MRKGIAVLAAAAIIALAGCGAPAVTLDREVTVSGLTLSVPSTWVEDGSDYGQIGRRSFSTTDDEDELGYIGINYSPRRDDGETPEEDMGERKEWYETDLGIDDFEYEMIDEMVVDGAECLIFEESHTSEPSHQKTTGYYVYVTSMDTEYTISVTGNVDINSVIETMSLD